MNRLIKIVVMVAMAMFAFVVALLATGTTSGERRWDIADLFARIVGAMRPSTIMLAITAIIPAMLLSAAAVNTGDDGHDDTAHRGSKRKRFLGLVIISTIALGLLTFLRSMPGGGGEEQQREHANAETASDGHDEHAGAGAGASSTAEQAAAA